MKNKGTPILVYFSIITAVIFWGFSFIWTNSLLQDGFPPYALIFFRMVFAAIILLLVSLISGKLERIARKDWGWFLLLVTMEPFIYFIGETLGLQIVGSPTLGSIIIATIPIFALIPGMIVYKEKITAINVFGVSITLPGILLVVFENGSVQVSHYYGIFLLFIAVFAAVGYSVIVKKLTNRYNSYTIVTYQHLLGAIYFLPLFLYNDASSISIASFTPEILKPLLFLAVLCSCVAFILFINSIKVLGIARTNIFTSLVPVVSAFGAFVMGHEGLNTRKIIGILIVILGVIIAQREKKKPVIN